MGKIKPRLIVTAHFYLSILDNIETLIEEATSVVFVTTRRTAVEKLMRNFPNRSFSVIDVGTSGGMNPSVSSAPDFLFSVKEKLDRNLAGKLCLVGAGPWSEIYCNWIKRNGGVGIDIGSAFDLLNNEITRPVHKEITPSLLKKLRTLVGH